MSVIEEITENRGTEDGFIVTFPWGLPGLEEYSEFVINLLEEDAPFYYMRSCGQPEIGLLLVNPFIICKEYEFDLDDEVASQIGISEQKQLAVLCTVNTSKGIESATVNLLAPVVINMERLQAKQVVLNDRRYSYRTPLSLERASDEGVR